jgi:hypothetical protein
MVYINYNIVQLFPLETYFPIVETMYPINTRLHNTAAYQPKSIIIYIITTLQIMRVCIAKQ